MRKLLFTTLISLFAFISNAQITFQKRYGLTNDQYGNYGQQTSDGGFVIVGSVYGGGAGLSDVYLVKTDSTGALLWTKKYGGQFWDDGTSVQQTTDGGYIIAGLSDSFSPDTSNDVYLIRTDSFGDTLWTKTFGLTGDQRAYSVQQTIDGGYIIAGGYLIKTDVNGVITWSKSYSGTLGFFSVQQTADSGYIITGGATGVGSSLDVYLMKTGVSGTPLWSKTFGGNSTDRGYSVRQTTDGGYIITGATEINNPAYSDVYLIRTDSIGGTLWTKTFGWAGQQSGGYSVQQTADGGFFIAGYTTNWAVLDTPNVYVIKTDAAGDTLWTKMFGGIFPALGRFGQQTTDGGYVVMGHIKDYPTAAEDVYLIKTDANGNSGCNEKSTPTIVISPGTIVTNPSTIVYAPFTPFKSPATVVGTGGIDTTLCISVGINELSTENSFLISPNPSSGNFEIKFSEIINKGAIEIYSVLGKRFFSSTIFNESKKEIQLKNISSGIYFLKIFDGEKSYCRKIVVERN
jgi:hypothetical protein